MSDEPITDIQYNECIKCIEYLQNAEAKNEQLTNTSLIVPISDMSVLRRKDIYKTLWTELESCLKFYQDLSDKHKFLYNHVKNLKSNFIKNENLFSRNVDPRKAVKNQIDQSKISHINPNLIPKEVLEMYNFELDHFIEF